LGFLDKVKETTKQVGDKAQQLAESGQEKLDDYKTEKRIADLEGQIGRLVFAQRTGADTADADTEIDRLVAEITAARAALENPDA
jgi:hypothetical protein